MSAVLLAVFNDYDAANRVRTELVRDGFPTDRVELTAVCDPGRAALQPAESPHDRFIQYYRTLFKSADDFEYVEALTDRIDCGAATITVHPRGDIETSRASRILESGAPAEVAHRDLASGGLEYAASSSEHPWIKHLWVQWRGDAHCIYCRMFERDVH